MLFKAADFSTGISWQRQKSELLPAGSKPKGAWPPDIIRPFMT
jgi:hypothetical protein